MADFLDELIHTDQWTHAVCFHISELVNIALPRIVSKTRSVAELECRVDDSIVRQFTVINLHRADAALKRFARWCSLYQTRAVFSTEHYLFMSLNESTFARAVRTDIYTLEAIIQSRRDSIHLLYDSEHSVDSVRAA